MPQLRQLFFCQSGSPMHHNVTGIVDDLRRSEANLRTFCLRPDVLTALYGRFLNITSREK